MLNHVTMSQARGANFNIFKERHEAEFMSDLAPVVKVKTSPLESNKYWKIHQGINLVKFRHAVPREEKCFWFRSHAQL